MCRVHSHKPHFRWFWGNISCAHSHMWIEPCNLLCWWHGGLYAGRLQCKWVAKKSITLVCRVHSHKLHVRWFWEHISCIHSHMWIEPCGLLSWWDVSLYVGRLQCKRVPTISITLVGRVHSHTPYFRWFLGFISCVHSHMCIEPCGLLSWCHVGLYLGRL